jgi:hypothetical protein
MSIICIVIGLLLSLTGNQPSDCNDFKKLLKVPPRSLYEYRSRYVNLSYEYTVVIPKGLTAYDGRDEPNHQGFWLALGKSPQSFIFVRGEPNSFEYATSRDAATKSLAFLRQAGKNVESEKISEAHLGTLNAARLEAIYTCLGSADRHRLSAIVAISTDKRFLYELELYSPANRSESDRAVLDQIIKSWKVLERSRRQKR